MEKWNEDEIAFIIQQKEEVFDKEGNSQEWAVIIDKYNKKYRRKFGKEDRSFESIRKCYRRYENYFTKNNDKIDSLKKLPIS